MFKKTKKDKPNKKQTHQLPTNNSIEEGLNERSNVSSSEVEEPVVHHFTDSRKDKSSPITSPKIVIHGGSLYKPLQIKKPHFSGRNQKKGKEQRYLILTDFAYNKMNRMLSWGYKTSQNTVEQGGILLGKVEQYKNEIYNIVEDVILANTKGSAMFVEFTSAMWADMQQELSDINKQRGNKEKFVIVGWFHTHPNNLPVFMSNTDINTQKLNFSQQWQASLVMNPHKKLRCVYFGEEIIKGEILLREGKMLSLLKERRRKTPNVSINLNGTNSQSGIDIKIHGVTNEGKNIDITEFISVKNSDTLIELELGQYTFEISTEKPQNDV